MLTISVKRKFGGTKTYRTKLTPDVTVLLILYFWIPLTIIYYFILLQMYYVIIMIIIIFRGRWPSCTQMHLYFRLLISKNHSYLRVHRETSFWPLWLFLFMELLLCHGIDHHEKELVMYHFWKIDYCWKEGEEKWRGAGVAFGGLFNNGERI